MIINSAPENIAVLGNVSEVGEFRIKNSAKAFAILSSGLYANKIRAIIRELSCNALDSHIAAGNKETPFDMHLPMPLEPYFSIRDYGTGLTHDQVINIYTTYFESTKTNSNDFIGALGLGSKSPFSYTDNFTVTAIRDGIKGIYSAFINEYGVPSVARMADAETDEPNGVEVKFAVDVRNDYSKFSSEAAEVLAYFPVKPNMTGAKCNIREIKYLERDVINGVNVIDQSYSYDNHSVAVMGNIPYPIEVPNSDSNLGQLAVHLKKNLEIRFEIGELEFQASREGLSYTKETIASIKNKLQLLQDKLDGLLEVEANAISNLWDRADFLRKKFSIALWQNSIKNYIRKTKELSFLTVSSYNVDFNRIIFTEDELAQTYNIKVTGFSPSSYGGERATQLKMQKEYDNKKHCYVDVWAIPTGKNTYFVKYEKFRGGLEHAKYHFKENVDTSGKHAYVFVLSPVKVDQPVLFDEFFKDMHNPPSELIIDGKDMEVKPREERAKSTYSITALKLTSTHSYRDKNYVWEPVQNIKTLDSKEKFYYIPIKGYVPIADEKYPLTDVKQLLEDIKHSGISSLMSIHTIYGIRKSDLEDVKTMKNWINIQDHLVSTISKVDVDSLVGSYAKKTLKSDVFNISDAVCNRITNTDSLYLKFMNKCKQSSHNMDTHCMSRICRTYGQNITVETFTDKIIKEIKEFTARYPLIEHIDYKAKAEHVAAYVNMIDANIITTTTTI